MVIHEAYARGKPVLTTRIGTIPEIVREGETGRLVSAGDEAALSEALESMLASPESLRRMGAAARRYAETELTPENHWRALESAYRRARARHAERAA